MPERCTSENPALPGERTLRCMLPAGHDMHINTNTAWSTLTGIGLVDLVTGQLGKLDGCGLAVLSIVTGLSFEEIDELGGSDE